MKRSIFAALAAFLVLAPAALAAKPHIASIAVASQTATTVTFAVEQTGGKPSDFYLLWISNTCVDAAGVTVTAEYQPVSTAGSFATDGTSPFAGPIVSCSASVAKFPDVWTPVSNTVTVVA
jgi:hypothetical protein